MDTEITKVLNGAKVATEKEIALVQQLAEDKSVMDIGKAIGMGHRSVETKLESMRKKFGCRSSKGLVTLFFRNQLIK